MANCRFLPGLALLAPLLLISVSTRAEIDPNGPDPLALEEVVVTANRRAESIQEVPMSVTAFTGEFFEAVNSLQCLFP